jgi:hypothetical protein
MRILTLFIALLIACAPVDNVPSSPQDLSLADLTGASPPDLTITVTGPTRIVQRTWTGSDGVVVKMVDLYDTVEKIPCALQRASDGVARCMPLGFTLYYQDPGCTRPVLLVTPGCAYDRYVNVFSFQCGGYKVVTSYRVGAKTSFTKLYLQNNTSCQDASATIGSSDIYDTTIVPPSTFAAGTFNY